MRPKKSDRVLEIGCGPGTLSLLLAPRASSVFGFDLSERMITEARRLARARRCRNAHFAVADAERLPVPDRSFDLIACRYTFSSLPAPGRAVREIHRVVRPGGRVAVVEAVAPNRLVQRQLANRLERLRSRAPVRLLPLRTLRALGAQRNLQLLDCRLERRPLRLEDWLHLSAYAGDLQGQRRLKHIVRQWAKQHGPEFPLRRQGDRWVVTYTVARLLWRK